ncbi:hypothetical protein [Arthrobacter sp. UYEF36]|uniref:hypothetical protein n=1 Tax=Arthrobacter sp. UYEF36 TaxID=1756366 RepID=UPI003397BAEF
MALLLAGAASYTHGSRYAVVGHSPFQSGEAQSPAARSDSPVWLGAVASSPGPGERLASASEAVHAVQQAGPFVEPGSMERECCERRQAPRGEPAPLRTGAVDPPSIFQPPPGDAVSNTVPPEPEPSALTVVQLSISRT